MDGARCGEEVVEVMVEEAVALEGVRRFVWVVVGG